MSAPIYLDEGPNKYITVGDELCVSGLNVVTIALNADSRGRAWFLAI